LAGVHRHREGRTALHRLIPFLSGGMLAAVLLTGCARPAATAATAWSPEAAARYLDGRADWWIGWRQAKRDHGTFCISCHTTLPYALARAPLRAIHGDGRSSPREDAVLESVRTRVRYWTDASPYYGAHASGSAKAVQSRATEAVLNALILADADGRAERLSDDTRRAFDNMWALQQPSGARAGAWPWLDFGLDPWEGPNGEYFGAALAALAIGTAPEHYASAPAIQTGVSRLRGYLDREYAAQPLSNRALLLWASTRLHGLLADDRRASLAADLRRAQQSDGGWSLELLSGRDRWWNPRRLSSRSDGYATGLVTLALSGVSGNEDAYVARGLAWLAGHQDPSDGSWPGYSLNALENSSPDVARFMNDAATAWAVLALAESPSQVK
jgi:squalene-hopene/tetraprenyl-beta-curcumene cyclase